MDVQPQAAGSRADLLTRREALARAAHLMGGALALSTVTGVLAACERGGSAGSALSADEKELVATIAEHILPRTDTPGARDVGVHDFIDEMMAEYYPEDERRIFLAGLRDLDTRADRAHGKRFMRCSPEEQRSVLEALDRETFEKRQEPPKPEKRDDVRDVLEPGSPGSPLPPEVQSDTIKWTTGERKAPTAKEEIPFFRTMKELTLVGYYTSEAGATQELRYAQVPGRYQGCVPFAQVGRTWAV